MKITLQPDLLRWARERAGLSEAVLAKKLSAKEEQVKQWEQDGTLTQKRAEKLAHVTHTPYGYLFLPTPPLEELPVPDFRTVDDAPVLQPSPNLLDTIYGMQQRQSWLRDHLIEEDEDPKEFVGSFDLQADPKIVAQAMKDELGLQTGWASNVSTWTAALMILREQIEGLGILIVFNGVVNNNSHRKLDPQEFRGFALADKYAPLVFINAADFKGAQMFTLAHELAHIWLGAEGVSNFVDLQPPEVDTELFCNKVAAEFLIPEAELSNVWQETLQKDEPFQWLARQFKVSTVVAARRALDLGLVERSEFFSFYEDYKQDERRKAAERTGGGSYWANQNVRIGRRFGQTVVSAARSGKILYRDAYSLLGFKTGESFDKYAAHLRNRR
ncbi:ImmA/IrrE family metallo-endopeptidase [Puniceicoccaceae bacterium K14]|nr:ImmA/IrrE family metallo-endopeptidase [Puniceicoccaceae bacterium K14]